MQHLGGLRPRETVHAICGGGSEDDDGVLLLATIDNVILSYMAHSAIKESCNGPIAAPGAPSSNGHPTGKRHSSLKPREARRNAAGSRVCLLTYRSIQLGRQLVLSGWVGATAGSLSGWLLPRQILPAGREHTDNNAQSFQKENDTPRASSKPLVRTHPLCPLCLAWPNISSSWRHPCKCGKWGDAGPRVIGKFCHTHPPHYSITTGSYVWFCLFPMSRRVPAYLLSSSRSCAR